MIGLFETGLFCVLRVPVCNGKKTQHWKDSLYSYAAFNVSTYHRFTHEKNAIKTAYYFKRTLYILYATNGIYGKSSNVCVSL